MAKITFELDYPFKGTFNFLTRLGRAEITSILNRYGQRGVDALTANTPVDTGLTSSSWYYVVKKTRNSASVSWHNSNVNQGVVIAVIIQYGYSTGSGGYVRGTDYINPALRQTFDALANEAWEEVTRVG